jgi:hypothetical protein
LDKIIISPWSRPLKNGERNPKNYPYWEDLVKLIKDRGIYTIQVGIEGEKPIGCDELQFNRKLDDLRIILDDCRSWISVDNFFPHFVNLYGKPGIVIWGQSDPEIYGYKQNINILKDRSFLRPLQFDIWESCSCRDDCWVKPEEVMEHIK